MTPTQRILTALRDHGHEPKRAGGGWTCRCPAHDDRRPSLSITEGDDGRVLLCCHAGCDAETVVAALGLGMRDLMPDTTDSDKKPTDSRSRAILSVSDASDGRESFDTMDEAITAIECR